MTIPRTKQLARNAFGFLERRGFSLEPGDPTSRFEGDLSWHLDYNSPNVSVRVLFDMHQFEVNFLCEGTRTSYLFIDRELNARRSGFRGAMFGPDKIDSAIAAIAADIETNYAAVLAGDRDTWARIARTQALSSAPKPRLP